MTIHINLVETRVRRPVDPVTVFLLALLVLAAAGFTLYSQALQARIEAEQALVAAAEGQIRELEATLPRLEEAKAETERLRQQVQAVSRLMDDPLRHAALLAEVGRVLPREAWLSTLAVDPATSTVTFSGTAAGEAPFASVSRLLEDLTSSPRFGEASLASAARTTVTGSSAPACSFQIEARYEGGTAP